MVGADEPKLTDRDTTTEDDGHDGEDGNDRNDPAPAHRRSVQAGPCPP